MNMNTNLTNGMKVKALKSLSNIFIEGHIYDVETVRKELSFVNLEDTNWFEPYVDSKFKVGDVVILSSSYNRTTTVDGRKIPADHNLIYKVINVKPHQGYRRIAPLYTIEDEVGHRYYAFENDIEQAYIYFVLSFSEKEIAIHQINKFAFEKRYKGKAKQMFVYKTYEAAETAKNYFNNYFNTNSDIVR